MSEKQAKAKRREEKEQLEQGSKPIGTVNIDVYPDLNVNVSNFPSDHNVAMMILCNAMMKVSAYFMDEQKKTSDIVLARPGASAADIIKMASGN